MVSHNENLNSPKQRPAHVFFERGVHQGLQVDVQLVTEVVPLLPWYPKELRVWSPAVPARERTRHAVAVFRRVSAEVAKTVTQNFDLGHPKGNETTTY